MVLRARKQQPKPKPARVRREQKKDRLQEENDLWLLAGRKPGAVNHQDKFLVVYYDQR